MPRHGRATALLALLLLLGACTGRDDHRDAASRSSSATAPTGSGGNPSGSASGSVGAEPSEQADFVADSSPDGGPARAGASAGPAGQMHVAGLRIGEHPGYSRLVVDLDTAGVPEWRVSYGERTGPGGGPVTVSGDAFLRLSLHTEAKPGAVSGSPSQATGSGVVEQARVTGLFEGSEEVLIGVQGSRRPFRAFALTDPGRIVIDVRGP